MQYHFHEHVGGLIHFNKHTDVLTIRAASPNDVVMNNYGRDLIVSTQEGRVVLRNMQIGDLNARNIMFAPVYPSVATRGKPQPVSVPAPARPAPVMPRGAVTPEKPQPNPIAMAVASAASQQASNRFQPTRAKLPSAPERPMPKHGAVPQQQPQLHVAEPVVEAPKGLPAAATARPLPAKTVEASGPSLFDFALTPAPLKDEIRSEIKQADVASARPMVRMSAPMPEMVAKPDPFVLPKTQPSVRVMEPKEPVHAPVAVKEQPTKPPVAQPVQQVAATQPAPAAMHYAPPAAVPPLLQDTRPAGQASTPSLIYTPAWEQVDLVYEVPDEAAVSSAGLVAMPRSVALW